MSITLKKLGINLDYFPREQEAEAIESLTSLRMEQILVGEQQKFNWQNLMNRPELIELNDDKMKNSQFQQQLNLDDEDDSEWIYAERSLYIFSRHNLFRLHVIRVLKTRYLDIWRFLFMLINVIGICIYDYKDRVIHEVEPNINRVSIGMEIISNIFYGLEMGAQIVAMGFLLEKGTYLRNGWNIVNMFAFLTTWSILYDNYSNAPFLNFCRIVRILRCARLIYDIPTLRKQMNAFVGSFPKLGPIIIPLLFVMFYYAIVGLHIFRGVTENRCRMTPFPEDGEWPADPEIDNTCGIWQCPEYRYCGNPADYGLPFNPSEGETEVFSYNLNRFDNFFYALFVMFTFINVTGWSGTTFFYWKAVSTYLTGFFFISLIFLLAYILSNLLLAAFYESFLVQSSIKQSNKAKQEEEQLEDEINKKRQHQMVERLAVMGDQSNQGMQNRLQTKASMYFSPEEIQNSIENEQGKGGKRMTVIISKSIYFIWFSCLITIIDTVALCSDYSEIPYDSWKKLQVIDFACMIYFYIELIIQLWGKGARLYLKKPINIFDTIIILSQIVLCIYCYITENDLIVNDDDFIECWKAIKIFKVLKFLYSAKIFHTISVLIRCLVDTILKIKNMIFLFLALVLIISVFGREFFAERIKFVEGEPEKAVDQINGISFPINYDNLGHALQATLDIFYNEEWHVQMFSYTRVDKTNSIVFFVLSILFGQVFFIRLLMAIFLNEFCKCLKHVDVQMKPFHHNKQVQNVFKTLHGVFSKANSPGKPAHLAESSAKKSVTVPRQVVEGQALQQRFDEVASNDQEMNIPVPPNNDIQSPAMEQQALNSNSNRDHEIRDNRQSQFQQSKHFREEEGKSPLKIQMIHILNSHYFSLFNVCLNLLTAVRIGLKTPIEDPNNATAQAMDAVFIVLTVLYALIMIANMYARGIIQGEYSYFKISPINQLLFCITIMEIATLIFNIDHPLARAVNSLRLIQFIQVMSTFSQDVEYALKALLNSFSKMIQLTLFCALMFMVYGVFATKMLKGKMFECTQLDSSIEHSEIITKHDCLDYGGNWVNYYFNFDTTAKTVLNLFVITTTEGWLPILENAWNAVGVDMQPIEGYNRWWSIYIELFFFISFMAMLNMFIGLIVNTYNESKLKAQHLHLLDETQREYFFIKKSILTMEPIAKSQPPKQAFRALLFRISKKQKNLKKFFIAVITFNILILAMYFQRMPSEYKQTLDIINTINIGIFTFEIAFRLTAKEASSYFSDFSNIVDVFLIGPCLANLFIRNNDNYGFQSKVYLNAISVSYQLLRGYRIIKRFNDIEKLFESIFSVIPSALSMLYIMFIFVFIYTSLGMDLFAYVRPQPGMNGFDLHFKNFSTGMFTLIKVASSEQWFNVLYACAHEKEPDFHCIEINNYDDFVLHGYNGCGTPYALIYYIFFHLVFSLMILNVFIASVLDAYEQHVKSEESAISKYQLNDVLMLWSKYDRRGLGCINYKDFWKLSSEIAIIFGVDASDLLDVNNKKNFLKVLNVPIYENTASNMLCYKFHDVILKLTKISVTLKYGATNLEPTDPAVVEKIDSVLNRGEKNADQFKTTLFSSGDMTTIIYIQKKMRIVRKRMKGEEVGEIGDLNNAMKAKN